MSEIMNPRCLLLAILAVATTGCGGGPQIVPVSGIVLIDGKPVPSGTVQVVVETGRAASGKIGPDGRFKLTTHKPDDGCFTGTHKVVVVANEPIGPSSQRWHAPRKYASANESELKMTITGPTSDQKIELTWDGGKPFVQHFGKE